MTGTVYGGQVTTIQQVAELAEKRGITVSFILQVPTWREHIPMALWKSLKQHKPLPVMTVQEQIEKTLPLDEAVSKIRRSSFRIYRVTDIFCRPNC